MWVHFLGRSAPKQWGKLRVFLYTYNDAYCRHSTALYHYNDIIMTTVASQITSLTFGYSIVYSGADQRKHQSSASLAIVWGIHREMFPFDDVIMFLIRLIVVSYDDPPWRPLKPDKVNRDPRYLSPVMTHAFDSPQIQWSVMRHLSFDVLDACASDDRRIEINDSN